jgi:hypothetical protein
VAQPFPDFQWEPEPFLFEAGDSQRYIDYDNGSDKNPGSKESPWKHHPWDPEASGKAAKASGIHTYVFKKGVAYRGQLIADESGEAGNPIRLTVDPDWGKGEAEILGSEKVNGNWKRYSGSNGLPFPEASAGKIWYIDLDIDFDPKLLWVIDDGEIVRVPVAREPDWEISNPDDPRSEWWEWTEHRYTGTIVVESTDEFSVGDKIWTLETTVAETTEYVQFQSDKVRADREASAIVITGIGDKLLRVECLEYLDFRLEGKTITNGHAVTTAESDIDGREHRVMDSVNLLSKEPGYYDDAIVWTEQLSYAGYGHPTKVESFSPEEQSVKFTLRVPWLEESNRTPSKYCRYFLENKPQFLDSPGEYYFDNGKQGGRLYIRLPDDAHPGKAHVEIARHPILIDITDQDHIDISGLSFRFENMDDWLANSVKIAAIQLLGDCSNITVTHCRFEHLIKAIASYPLREGDVTDYIEVSDNQIAHTDQNAVALRFGIGGAWGYNLFPNDEPLGRLVHVDIFRNHLYDIGERPSPGEACHAIEIKGAELVEIAYNVVDRVYAGGIQAINNRFSGECEKLKDWGSPLNRSLIHHNKVTNAMLMGNDWGAISSWGVGPSYAYSNIVGNSVGHRHSFYRSGWPQEHDFHSFFSIVNKNFGIAYYFDFMYKGYCFNNIAWGKENDLEERYYNAMGYFQTDGSLNHVFQNTFYRFAVGTMSHADSFRVLGNLYLDSGYSHITHSPQIISTTAYANNAFEGDVEEFALGGGESTFSLTEFQQHLERGGAAASNVGFALEDQIVRNAAGHDFRLVENAQVVDKGVKVFVPWGLYKAVGEWNFHLNSKDPGVLYDDHFVLNEEWRDRGMYLQIPRHDLIAHNVTSEDYEYGLLEDWTEGALNFDGVNQYGSIDDASTKADYSWKDDRLGESGSYPGEKRLALDVNDESFLIEVVFKTSDGQTGGTLVSKGSDDLGYHLVLDKDGKAQLRIGFGEHIYVATASDALNDNEWHHLVAEYDREKEAVKIFVDGRLSQIEEVGALRNTVSLTNQDDFTVGRLSTEAKGFFRGSMDFLRLSQGSLADSETTIEELYEWQFNGPFLKDFFGNDPKGAGRDVGAIESN